VSIFASLAWPGLRLYNGTLPSTSRLTDTSEAPSSYIPASSAIRHLSAIPASTRLTHSPAVPRAGKRPSLPWHVERVLRNIASDHATECPVLHPDSRPWQPFQVLRKLSCLARISPLSSDSLTRSPLALSGKRITLVSLLLWHAEIRHGARDRLCHRFVLRLFDEYPTWTLLQVLGVLHSPPLSHPLFNRSVAMQATIIRRHGEW
jgi:hypothetical protein